jgi:UDP-GlcNAc3NAcA epimerase
MMSEIKKIKIITIIGARPQIIKSSAIDRAIKTKFSSQLEEVIVHTGQHYDSNMSDVFFQEMGIPKPKYNLSVGSGSHGTQTGKMMEGLEAIFVKENPDGVLVYGDTNSTIAGALAAAKIHIPVIHVEAGLRSFNKRMPEEINRISCDHMSTLLFTPTVTGIDNLKREGFSMDDQGKADINNPRVYHCGDVMYDNSLYFSQLSDKDSKIIEELKIEKESYILVTIHRDGNTDVAENMENIFNALLTIQKESGLSIVLPLHPRTKSKLEQQLSTDLYHSILSNPKFKIIEPAGFMDIIALEKHSTCIITDSGGLQKESYFFKKPCIILRPQTEWVEIVNNGNAILADANYNKIVSAYEVLSNKKDFTFPDFYGNGKAGEFICEKIIEQLG